MVENYVIGIHSALIRCNLKSSWKYAHKEMNFFFLLHISGRKKLIRVSF